MTRPVIQIFLLEVSINKTSINTTKGSQFSPPLTVVIFKLHIFYVLLSFLLKSESY